MVNIDKIYQNVFIHDEVDQKYVVSYEVIHTC